jgi:hypothetical protein
MQPPHLLLFAKYLLSDANRTSKLRWPDFWQICHARPLRCGISIRLMTAQHQKQTRRDHLG